LTPEWGYRQDLLFIQKWVRLAEIEACEKSHRGHTGRFRR
jgi:hypothetical protein